MTLKSRWRSSREIELCGEITSILEQLNACCRGAEQNVEWFPLARLAQRCTEPTRRMTQEIDDRHPAKKPALEQDEAGMQVTNDRPFNSR